MKYRQKPSLSELENKVMAVVWKHGQATAELVRNSLQKNSLTKNPVKDSTVRTILRRLEDKGYLQHSVEGRTYVYVPTIKSQSVAAEAVRGIIDRFCNGSVEDLIVGLVEREVLSPEKLNELANRIASDSPVTKRPNSSARRKKGK